MVAITASLQGEAVVWAAILFSDHARELGDAGLFLDVLRARFEDPSWVQHAEIEVLGLRQRGRPIREYVREFHRAAGRLCAWPEHLLVYHFRHGLDKDLQQACVVQGMLCRLQDWFRVESELDAGLQEFWWSTDDQPTPRQTGERLKEASQQPPTSVPPVKPTFGCFRCNEPGHRVAPGPGTAKYPGDPGETGSDTKENPGSFEGGSSGRRRNSPKGPD
ncbi:RTL1: Retrotransposon-like 1 [Crotalus adamanteus]|uniref:RTL1: Retrotransposon-like 1 n=1 Tax=Crotalus adamanteus TaxID=8729 RepID=A0AAW1B3R4_CROAD